MTLLTLAIVVGVLFATGTYLILHRRAIRLILGLGLLTHGVNLLLFSSGGLGRGLPPIVLDKKAFAGDISPFVDPLPQALILTAIVISFAVTAFTVVLVNRRHALAQTTGADPMELPSLKAEDPFAAMEHYASGLDGEPDDYEWLEFSLADELRRRRARVEAEKAEKAAQAATAAGAEEAGKTSAEQSNKKNEPAPDDHMDSQDGDLLTSEAFTSESGPSNSGPSNSGPSNSGPSESGNDETGGNNFSNSEAGSENNDEGEQA